MLPLNKEILIDDLKVTRNILAEEGWCQFHLETRKGEHCLLGAIQKAVYTISPKGHNGFDRSVQVMFSLRRELGKDWHSASPEADISNWNDGINRTSEDVLNLLDTVIEAEEAVLREAQNELAVN